MSSELVRTWKGDSPQTRIDSRRQRLIDAALELLGGEEPGQFTMRAACRHAELSQRYFYETFTDRDELAAAAYESCARIIRSATITAAQGVEGRQARTHAAFTAIVEVIQADPRIGRVMFREAQTDPTVRKLAEQELPDYIRTMMGKFPDVADVGSQQLAWIVSYLAGGLFRLFDEWIATGMTDSSEFVDFCSRTVISALQTSGRSEF